MNQNRLDRVEALFLAGLEMSSAEREDFWARECGEEQTLLDELRHLLRAHQTPEHEDPLEGSVWALQEVNSFFGGEDLVGKTINDYQILQSLGQGAMGEVYLAQKPPLTRQVVIKMVADPGNAGFRKQFLEEMRVHEKLRHENIVMLLDAGTYGQYPYIVLEYFPGQTLHKYLRGPDGQPRTLPLDQILTITRQLADGLAYAHREFQITHRDIKPENILILPGPPLRAKIIDFGIAILPELDLRWGDRFTSRRFTYGASGTPLYMSPEQIRNLVALERVATIDPRTDIFALGLVLYEMLTGQPPFGPDLVRDERQIVWPTRRREDLSPAVDDLLRKALAEDPVARYQTVEQLFHDLEEALCPLLEGRPAGHPHKPRYWGVLTRLFSPFSSKD
ncbi:MAG: serine/threonine-protein kinase [Blastocatellia bacterium]